MWEEQMSIVRSVWCRICLPKKAAEPLVLPVVALTRSQAGSAPALTLPVNDDINSLVGVVPDRLSGRVRECSTQVSDTARVSVLPNVGSELQTVYVGNGALDVVGLRVGPRVSEWIRRKPCRLCKMGEA